MTSSPVSIVGTAENNSVVELFKGGTSVGTTTASSSGAFSFSGVALSRGANSFTATATDAATNKSPVSTPAVVITFNPPDTTAPAAPVFSNPATARTTPFTFEGTADNGSTVKLYAADGTLIATTTSVSGAFSFTNIPLDVGVNTFTATATDPVGNISAASSTTIKLIDTTLIDDLAELDPNDFTVTADSSRFDGSDRILDITFNYASSYPKIEYFTPGDVGIFHDDGSTSPSWESHGLVDDYTATSSSYIVTHSYKFDSVCSLSGNENVTFTSFIIDTSNDRLYLMQHEQVFCPIPDESLPSAPNGILNPTFSFLDYNEDYNSFNVHLKSDVGAFPSDYDFVMFAIQDETVIKSDIDPDTPAGNTLLFSILNSGFDFGKDITFRVEFKTDSGEFYEDYSLTVADLLKISNEKSNPKLKTFTITGSDPLHIAYNDFVENSLLRSSFWYAPDNFSSTTVPPNSDPVQLLNCLDPNIDTYPFVLRIDYEITKTFYAKIIDNRDTPMRECVTTPVFSSESSTYVKSSFSLYVEPVSDPEPPKKKKSGGSSNDWHKKPTFGQSHLTYKQILDDGFSFNGHSLTITDNWHTDFLLTSSIIGESNTVTIKTYSADPLKWVDLHLGVPRQGGFSEAESHINLVVSRNYTNPVDYTIDEINHYQKESLVDEANTTASVNKVKCQSTDNDEKCYEFTILFAVNAPLLDNVVAISAMDEKRRQHVTYINEGVEFTGESLLDPRTAQLMEKLGNQYDATIIELTQQDRRYNIWEDQHGYLWSQNEYGTWMQTTHPDFERFQDKTSNVMTRQNSNFASLIEHERQKALLVFDSSNIASQVGDYFAYDYSDIDRDTSKLEKYYLELQIENQKAQQYTNKN